ncbi:MAG: integrin alpha, partial [Pseudomonadota bacterium]
TGSGNGRPPDLSGLSVSSADVNGDGLADLLIGSGQKPNVVSNTGSPNLELGGVAYVFFGTSEPMPAAVELSTLDGTNGFTLLGLVPGGGVGASIAGAGDLNGDGKDEILVGAPQGGGNFSTRGPSSYDYIVYGSDQPFDPVVGLAEPGSQTGDVVILTGNQSYQRGDAVSAAGDINNDGFDDLMAGNWPTNNGASVVFGGPNLPSVIDLDQLTGSDGFNIATGENGFGSPWLAEAGDVNDDGIKDFLVGQPEAKGNTGEVYLVFGTEEGFPANLDPSTLDGTNGLILNTGSTDSDSLGVSVSGNGDVNGDGIDDIAIAAFSGQSVYIVYGTDDHSDEVGVTFEGDEANDRFFGESSPDRAFGGPGRDLLFGGDDDDFLFGGPDNDKLFGGKDDDELRGGLGRDLKVGGRGDDTYAGTAEELDGDRIIGFGPGDQIVIDSFDFDVEVEKKWFGSSEISFDTDGNGSLDGSLKVYGVFGRRDFDVEQVGDDTVITLGEPEPFGGFFSSFFERISDGWDFF